jgi:dTDP-4-dehydrorhamnose reductase
MKILATGKSGQVGYELMRSLQPLGEVIGVDRSVMDLSDVDQVRGAIAIRKMKPSLVVNSAAYTAVNKAESEPDLATRINGLAPGIMAEEAAKLGQGWCITRPIMYLIEGSRSFIRKPMCHARATRMAHPNWLASRRLRPAVLHT